jgi:hypothetical protein
MNETTEKSHRPKPDTLSLEREPLGAISGEVLLKAFTSGAAEQFKDQFQQRFWVTAEFVHHKNENTRDLAAIVLNPM